MSRELDAPVLAAILAGWDRHNRVLINLAGAIPEGGFAARALPGSPSVGEMFTHMHHERMVSVAEEAPEHGGAIPDGEWEVLVGADEIAEMLEESGRVVRGAVEGRVAAGRPLDLHFRPSGGPDPVPDLPRGIPPRPDQAGAEGGGAAPLRRGRRTPDLGCVAGAGVAAADGMTPPLTPRCTPGSGGSGRSRWHHRSRPLSPASPRCAPGARSRPRWPPPRHPW
jgi:hypothetical protein